MVENLSLYFVKDIRLQPYWTTTMCNNLYIYTTREHSKNKQDNPFCRDLFVFISGLFIFISVTRRPPRAENNMQSSQSWDTAQYPEIADQSNCAILGGSRVAYTNVWYCSALNCFALNAFSL